MMSKDYLDISSHDKNMQKFPARISSKVPVQIAMHSRNNSSGYEGHHSYNKNDKVHEYDIPLVKPIAINALSRNPKDDSLTGSYHSYFSLGQTPSNSSTSSSTTLKTFYNNNNSADYPFRFDEDDFTKNKFDNKMSINPSEYNESVTMAVLNSEGYANKMPNSSRESSPEFEFDNLRGYSKSYNDKDVIDIKSLKNKDNLKSYTLDNNNSKSKEEKMYKKLVSNEMIFSPDESPIIIPDKPSNSKVDMSKSVLFKNSNSSTDSLSSGGSHSGKKRVSLKKARNSINLSRTRSSSLGGRGSGRIDYDDYPLFNLENHPADVRSFSLPRRSIDIQKIDTSYNTTRSRSNTLPRSLIISPAKDEKYYICTSPRKDYNVQDIPAVKAMEYERRNNYNSYDDDKGSFVYNQSELISPSICDVNEYRNFLKSKNYDIPDANEERRHRSLSRKHESRYRSLSRSSDSNEKSESKRRSKSKSKSKGDHHNSPVKNMDDESRYRSLSRSRKDSRDDERVEKIEKERAERMEKEYKESKERRRSSSRHKKHRKNKSSSNHDSPLVKSSPIVRNNSRGSNVGSPLIKKEPRPNNIGSPLVRKDSRGSNMGSPLVRKESYSSPLAPTTMSNSKFSTAYIQNEYNRSPFDGRNFQTIDSPIIQNSKSDYPRINTSDDDDDHKNNKRISRTVGESKNKDIINEIYDLKKFSQDFSSLNILESILNRPIEDDFEFLNYNRPNNSQSETQKFSTLTRLPSQNKRRSKSRDIKRRNSDMDFNKGHHRASSEQLRSDDGSGKGSKRNIFNFFSHKKSKSYSSSSDKSYNSDKSKAPDFDQLIKGNETLKLTLQSSSIGNSPYIAKASIDGYSSDSDSDINNEEYSTSYKNFLKEKMMNQQQNQYNQQPQNQYNQPISNIKDYTPLFRINMLNNANNNMNHHMDFYGAKKDIPSNPYDQFNDFSMEGNERRSVNIGNRYSSLGRYSKHGSKRMNY